MAQQTNDQRESRRILERVAREAEAGGIVQQTARRAHNHLAAADVDPDDRIEQWGTRIGRIIAALVSIAVIVAVLIYLARG
jgi:cytochrome c-type biogenesis protein CcmH/NrfG